MDERHSALVLVLQRIPTKQRLSVCALVSQAWRAAANNATVSVDASNLCHPEALQQWLAKHGAHTQVSLTVAKDPTRPSYKDLTQLPFPCSSLKNLKSLTLSSTGIVRLDAVHTCNRHATLQQQQQEEQHLLLLQQGSALAKPCLANLADVLVHLTALCLSKVHVKGWVQAVPALANLQDLTLREAQGAGSRLPLLTALTALDYTPAEAECVPVGRFSALSRLTRLKHLSLGLPAAAEGAAVAAAAAPAALLSEALSGIQQLTGLESLSFRAQQYHLTVEAAHKLLQPLVALTGLTLYCKCDVSVFSDLTALQYLDASKALLSSRSPSDFQALTASPCLQQLHVNFDGWPAVDVRETILPEVLSEERHMPSLHTLTVWCDQEEYGGTLPSSPPGWHADRGAVLALLPRPCVVLGRAAMCCPNLRHLEIINTCFSPAQLAAVTSLSCLTALRLTVAHGNGDITPPPYEDPDSPDVAIPAVADWQDRLTRTLAQLTTLESLAVEYWLEPSVAAGTAAAMRLQSLTKLAHLCLPHPQCILSSWRCCIEPHRDIYQTYRNKAPEGSPPDVCLQLQQPIQPVMVYHCYDEKYQKEKEAREFENLASNQQWYCEQLAELHNYDFAPHRLPHILDFGPRGGVSRKGGSGVSRVNWLYVDAGGMRLRCTTKRLHHQWVEWISFYTDVPTWLSDQYEIRQSSVDRYSAKLVQQLAVPESSVVSDQTSASVYRTLRDLDDYW